MFHINLGRVVKAAQTRLIVKKPQLSYCGQSQFQLTDTLRRNPISKEVSEHGSRKSSF